MKPENYSVNHSPIVGYIFRNANIQPDKVAIVSGSARVSYKELARSILSAAFFLQSEGLSPSDTIALFAEKELNFIYLYFAAHLSGITNVILDPESNPNRIEYILKTTHPKLIFGAKREESPSKLFADLSFSENPSFALPSGPCQSDTADIMFTTGTTGLPKGVCLSHKNLFSTVKNINGFICNSVDDTEVLGLPLCHSFGLGRLRCVLTAGGTIVLLNSFANIKLFFDALHQNQATGFSMVPANWAYIRKLSGIRIAQFANQIKYIEIGSAAMLTKDKRELCNLFPSTRICMHYGLTEASRTTFMEFHENLDHLETIGRPASDSIMVKIMDENGCELSHGKTGEICVSGESIMSFYYLPKDNEKAFFNSFFRTGDLGYQSEDGRFYLISRIKEILNIGGKKVSPTEIEDAINSIGALDSICIGVPDPNGILGEVPKAFILAGSPISLEEIKTKLTGVLENYKIPVFYEWIDKIPKTASGKKQRLSLRRHD